MGRQVTVASQRSELKLQPEQVTARALQRELTTEMHFVGDEKIPDDPIIDGLTMRQHRMLTVAPAAPPEGGDPTARLAVFDIVLAPPAKPSTPGASWTGTITFPGGAPEEVRYDVGLSGGRIAALSIYFPEEDKSYPTSNVRWDSDTLKFSWRPGGRVECALDPAAKGGYSGPCTDGEFSGEMVMLPPG